MTVNTKTVTGRRKVHYENLNELLADAERLSEGEVTLIGNWSRGKIFGHISRSLNFSIDVFPFKVNWAIRMIAKLFMKKKFLTKPLPAGFQIPEKNQPDFVPENDDTEQGLAELREAIQRFQTDPTRVKHAILGELTAEEWEQFHRRHAEMHMSFIIPAGD